MKNETFSWVFIIALGFAAIWAVSKLTASGNPLFSGLQSQRGLAGSGDQFGNPLTPSSTGVLSS